MRTISTNHTPVKNHFWKKARTFSCPGFFIARCANIVYIVRNMKKRTNLSLSERLRELLAAKSKETGLSWSAMIEIAVREWLQKQSRR